MTSKTPRDLGAVANRLRIAAIEMTTNAGSGHPGGSLSSADVFAALYFGGVMKYRPKEPHWPGRDYFILSNGHICPAWYACLAEAGSISKSDLVTLRKFGSKLQGHPTRGMLPQVEVSTGSLGQGIGVAVGIAAGLKMQGKDNRVFCSMGDGELEEGSCWEAFMAAGRMALGNLTIFVDRNRLQQNGATEKIGGLEPLNQKLRSFNINVIEADGNNAVEILGAFDRASKMHSKTSVILFNTVMGRGVAFMEGDHQWHGKALPQDKAKAAIEELKTRVKEN